MKYPKRVFPSKGDTNKSDTPINLPYPTKQGIGKKTGASVNITTTVYPNGIPSSKPNRQTR